MSYLDDRRQQKIYGKQQEEKKRYFIPKKSAKKIAEEQKEKEFRGDADTVKEIWFVERRKELTGVCQCGCNQPSQKDNDEYFRHSICHVFPQKIFPSISLHPLNFIERAFFGGCHTNMDSRGMDLWPQMRDWSHIKEIFFLLSRFITEKEKATKFYSTLEKLVYAN